MTIRLTVWWLLLLGSLALAVHPVAEFSAVRLESAVLFRGEYMRNSGIRGVVPLSRQAMKFTVAVGIAAVDDNLVAGFDEDNTDLFALCGIAIYPLCHIVVIGIDFINIPIGGLGVLGMIICREETSREQHDAEGAHSG